MTPQKKAEELVNKMFNCDNSTPEESMAMLYPHAKQCALIAVDEIISLMIKFHNRHIEDNSNEITFWQEVKQEINKL
jgi:hypothetical protein